MKANPSVQRRGVALVIVLVFVVLLSVFILSFFTNSQNELSAAQSFSGQISAQQLAETATSVVMGQIREATSRPGSAWASQPGMIRSYGGAAATSTTQDAADAFFKLYSSDDMVIGPGEMSNFIAKWDDNNRNNPKFMGGEIPIDYEGKTGWNSQPAIYTDLNSPIPLSDPVPNGPAPEVKFPIIDGHGIRLVELPSIPALPSSEPARQVLSYDQTNASGDQKPDNVADIEGFAINPKTVKYNPDDPNGLTPENTPVPMPVKWIYVLRDGSLTSPTGVKQDEKTELGTQATWETGKRAPTKSNPIVGRIAFWADDDTCKVNINTAAGFNFKDTDRSAYKTERSYAGSYWDQPRTYTKFDYGLSLDDNRYKGETGTVVTGGLSITQPVAKEYQRYPGHPATTSLGLLFKDLLNSEQIYSILPRLVHGGTMNGTRRFYGTKDDVELPEGVDEDEFTTPLTPKRNRIFASVDEFLFGPRVTENDEFRQINDQLLRTNDELKSISPNGQTQETKDFRLQSGQSAVTPELLERMRFFLTAHSRAPELNLFGRPRVTIWPSYPDAARLNASDRLLNFCSIIGPRTRADGSTVPAADIKLFEFQRSDPYSPTNDWDGTKPSHAKYADLMPRSDGETRNQFLYRYLQDLTSKPVPGFAGKSFEQKYAPINRDQILTTIFDYMRTVNMRDSTRDKLISPENPKDPVAAKWPEVEKYKFAPLGVVVPLQIKTSAGETRGFGRFPTISEASIVLYHTGYRNEKFFPGEHFLNLRSLNQKLNEKHPKTGTATDKDWSGKEGVTHNTVSAFVIFEMFTPMMGYAPTRNLNEKSADRVRYVMKVKGLDQFQIEGTGNAVLKSGGLNFPTDATNMFDRSSGSTYHGRNLGGCEGYLHLLMGNYKPTANLLIPYKWGVFRRGAKPLPSDHYYEFQGDWPGVLIEAPKIPDPALPDLDPNVAVTQAQVDAVAPEAKAFYDFHNSNDASKTNLWQKLLLKGATLEVDLRFGQVGKEQTIRNLKMSFPEQRVPMPTDLTWSDPGGFFPHPKDRVAADDQPKSGGRWSSSKIRSPDMNQDGVKRFGDRLNADPLKAVPTGNNGYSVRSGFGGVFDNIRSDNDSGATVPGKNSANRWRQLIQPGDTVRSLVLGADGGDPRVAAVNDEQSKDVYLPHPEYTNENARHAQILRTALGPAYLTRNSLLAPYATAAASMFYYTETKFGKLAKLGSGLYQSDRWPDIPGNVDGVRLSLAKPLLNTGPLGDFDTGFGSQPDGPFTGKADEGNPVFRRRASYKSDETPPRTIYYWVYPHPYFDYDYEETFDTFFTPNRQTPSAVVFGSLPLGKNGHWATLCFSPFPACEAADASGATVHPGHQAGAVRDHLLLDLFNMPIVEPYAISEPFSTAGKVNLNYPIMPFGNIERNTALRAVLHSVRVSAFPTIDSAIYKTKEAYDKDFNYRYPVDRDMTLRAFDEFFNKFKANKDSKAGLFRSASEICDRGLYPLETVDEEVRAGSPIKVTVGNNKNGPDLELKNNFWKNNSMTGDNMREKPYSDIYPRITTKSNTYTVHIRAQSLRQTVQSADKGIWDEKKDRVIGEYRGSSTIERFIDPEDARFDPKSTTVSAKDKINVDEDSLEKAYRFRVINTKRFVP
jgi:hypothetical protein